MSTTNKEEKVADVSTENIYRLNGRVPLKKAIPFGLQHVLAMFVSNLAPVLIVCSAALRQAIRKAGNGARRLKHGKRCLPEEKAAFCPISSLPNTMSILKRMLRRH